MDTQLIVRIDEATKRRFTRLARTEGKTASGKIRELVSSYLEENDFSRMVGDLWDSSARALRKKGYTQRRLDDAIRRARTSG